MVRSRGSAVDTLFAALFNMKWRGVCVLVSAGLAGGAQAEAGDQGGASPPSRPVIGFYRWQEDWSALASPAVSPEPGDALKYIPLSSDDPKRYVSFGATLRERYENNNAPMFGTVGNKANGYLLHRLELHADAHVTDDTRIFAQIENTLAPGLNKPNPAQVNKLDLRLLFADTQGTLGDGAYKLRIGRQEMAFDLQRFVSVRDGPNVRQAYDAIWADYEIHHWRFTAFDSHPVQYQNHTDFDDASNTHLTYGGGRLQRQIDGAGELSLTLSQFHQDNVHFLAGSGNEQRNNIDLHYMGVLQGFDWDVEAMQQSGRLGGKTINAWGAGSLAGYTWATTPWKPRLGLQLDAASGDKNLSDQHVGTFNPLFPNGYYVTLSGYTGYTNFIHLKPSLTLTPASGIKCLFALGMLWRQTTHDAIYLQPNIPVPGTAGAPGRRSSTYGQFRVDWAATRSLSFALEDDYYDVGQVIRNAGGHNSNYFGLETRWGW